MSNQQVIINIGVSGSGKSTWTTTHIMANPNFLRINRDDIRKTFVGSLIGYYKRKDLNKIEDMVTVQEKNFGHQILLQGYSVIVDNTNLSSKVLLEKLKQVEEFNKYYGKNVEIKIKLFSGIDLYSLRRRVSKRDGLSWEDTQYIVKQYDDFLKMKEYVFEHHKDKLYEQSS